MSKRRASMDLCRTENILKHLPHSFSDLPNGFCIRIYKVMKGSLGLRFGNSTGIVQGKFLSLVSYRISHLLTSIHKTDNYPKHPAICPSLLRNPGELTTEPHTRNLKTKTSIKHHTAILSYQSSILDILYAGSGVYGV
ncbi:hypothetical protein BDV30DRAFT_58040 [Aspergillus minisclerotigenes]|uniref:Uncharacterized protein n=1 Tax=Aspergillus minisclerotigenes TaxID=656917 RepID=A0A5N6JCJ9_9EURO|nr:hypothetical protein BDV30DRAFT_58040 [Aspergillus minisclerotigenes]